MVDGGTSRASTWERKGRLCGRQGIEEGSPGECAVAGYARIRGHMKRGRARELLQSARAVSHPAPIQERSALGYTDDSRTCRGHELRIARAIRSSCPNRMFLSSPDEIVFYFTQMG